MRQTRYQATLGDSEWESLKEEARKIVITKSMVLKALKETEILVHRYALPSGPPVNFGFAQAPMRRVSENLEERLDKTEFRMPSTSLKDAIMRKTEVKEWQEWLSHEEKLEALRKDFIHDYKDPADALEKRSRKLQRDLETLSEKREKYSTYQDVDIRCYKTWCFNKSAFTGNIWSGNPPIN